MKQTELLNVFEDGISKEKLKKIELRKDALMILRVKQKYDIIAKRMESPISPNYNPIVTLKDGRNLFELEDYEIEHINYIYELKFQEIDYLRIKVLSLLPELCKLEIKFSNIWLPDLKPEISQNIFFPNLQYLDLSFNNLSDEILYYIKSVRTLKTLNLMGNQITHEIPDLSDLVYLEDLNLSSNNIISYFLNINMATNNYSDQMNTNMNTHVSHFNLMLTGKEMNNKNMKKIIRENTNINNKPNNNESNIKNEGVNKMAQNYKKDMQNETQNDNNALTENAIDLKNPLESPIDIIPNINNISHINQNNNNISHHTTANNINNLQSNNKEANNISVNNEIINSNEKIIKNINSNDKTQEKIINDVETFDRISNNSKNLINDLRGNTEYTNNDFNNNINKKTEMTNNESQHRKYSSNKIFSSNQINNNEDDEFDENYQPAIDTYEDWQKFLRTNLQEFYHKLSALKNLKSLNLSHNKIHFFDIDPYYIQQTNGFSKLNTLDVSYNLIEEEISILLVMNIPNLKSIDITCNPITRKKTAYENIEYEIFKTKNILLINSKPYNFNFEIWEPHNKINFTRRKNFNKYANLNEENEKKSLYKVNNDVKIEPVRFFNKKMKTKINSMLEKRKKMNEEIIKNEIPEYEIDILENTPENIIEINENDNLNKSNKDDKLSLKSYLNNSRKNKENVFLTNTNSQINKLMLMKDKNIDGNEGSENYINFLNLANTCFGKEKHYKDVMPISNAYQKLRFILNNLPSSVNENYEASNRYMKPTISRSIFLDEYKPDNKNYKKEFKILKEMNRPQVINESKNEDNFNSSIY